MTVLIPKTVFVPFEWDGSKWIKRDDLPRFKEPEEAIQHWTAHPEILRRNGAHVFLQWVECHEWLFIKEFLKGLGSR